MVENQFHKAHTSIEDSRVVARFEAFTNGSGSVYDKDSLDILRRQTGVAANILPQREDWLEQLRADKVQDIHSDHGHPRYTSAEEAARGYASEATSTMKDFDALRSYKPAQIKDINTIATAVENGDEKTLESMMTKYRNYPNAMEQLQTGLSLELKRRAPGEQYFAGIGEYRDNTDHMRPMLDVHTPKDQSESGKRYPADIHYYNE